MNKDLLKNWITKIQGMTKTEVDSFEQNILAMSDISHEDKSNLVTEVISRKKLVNVDEALIGLPDLRHGELF